MQTFNEAAKTAVVEALRLARSLTSLSAETNIRTTYLAAYASGLTVVPEDHLRAINDYLRRRTGAT